MTILYNILVVRMLSGVNQQLLLYIANHFPGFCEECAASREKAEKVAERDFGSGFVYLYYTGSDGSDGGGEVMGDLDISFLFAESKLGR